MRGVRVGVRKGEIFNSRDRRLGGGMGGDVLWMRGGRFGMQIVGMGVTSREGRASRDCGSQLGGSQKERSDEKMLDHVYLLVLSPYPTFA